MFIDTQVHVGPLYDQREPLTPKALLDWMDANNVEMAAPLPLESPEAVSYYITSCEMIALANRHRDRFLPFCVMDPRMSTSHRTEGPRNVIRRYVEMGAVGFGEAIPPLPMDDPLQLDVFAACDEFRLPVVLHQDNDYCTDTPRSRRARKGAASVSERDVHRSRTWILGSHQRGRYPEGDGRISEAARRAGRSGRTVAVNISEPLGGPFGGFWTQRHHSRSRVRSAFP